MDGDNFCQFLRFADSERTDTRIVVVIWIPGRHEKGKDPPEDVFVHGSNSNSKYRS